MRTRTKTLAAATAAALMFSLASCGSGTGSSGSDEDTAAEITWWGWGDTASKQAEDFMKTHQNITVKVTNAGTSTDQYTALNNALSAGSGVPDLATIEYYALPQFAYTDKLVDLTQFGADKFSDDYTPGTWSSVNIKGGIYALLTDSGPMAMFYNKEVFDKAGVTSEPTTWDEYYEAAKKIRATGSYITSDGGDAGFYNSMVWQAGGTPYEVSDDGQSVALKLTSDSGVNKFNDFWQKMIDEDLIDTKTQGWSDDWNKALADGSIASLLIGAWMPVNLESGAASASGKWRVAQMPTPEENSTANAENGGSSIAIFDNGDEAKTKAAWEFLEYINHSEEGTQFAADQGVFPARTSVLESDDFLNKKSEYFGDEQINKVLAEAADNVLPGWKFLPFEVYARSIFTDKVAGAYEGKTTLKEGVEAWQESLATCAEGQGFTVND